jgi:hypothetical protein
LARATEESTLARKPGRSSFQGLLTGLMMVGGCGPGAVLWVGPDRNQKTMMVEGFVTAFAKAARVSDVPEEAITSDTRKPSYMFLAAEWNRSTVSERAYLLAMLFGREFEVEANDFSLQIADLAMMMLEPDGSPALIARADLAAADDGGTRTGAAD